MIKRRAISKKVRFDVFKRDSFKCQYCGASAPDALLHVDLINPVSKGGKNDILNLVTACSTCNGGKSDRELSDDSAVSKAKSQLDDLNERREQLRLMVEWRDGLQDLQRQSTGVLCKYWESLAFHHIGKNGEAVIHRLAGRYSISEVLEAMDVAAERYLVTSTSGNPTLQSWEIAFDKIGSICSYTKAVKADPELLDLYKIRAGLRRRFSYINEADCIRKLRRMRDLGVPIDTIRHVANGAKYWRQFTDEADTCISVAERAKGGE